MLFDLDIRGYILIVVKFLVSSFIFVYVDMLDDTEDFNNGFDLKSLNCYYSVSWIYSHLMLSLFRLAIRVASSNG